jgi:hypothetical protein
MDVFFQGARDEQGSKQGPPVTGPEPREHLQPPGIITTCIHLYNLQEYHTLAIVVNKIEDSRERRL